VGAIGGESTAVALFCSSRGVGEFSKVKFAVWIFDIIKQAELR